MPLDLEIADDAPPETRIVVAKPTVPAELVLVETAWVNALTAVEGRVKELKITDATTAQMASDLQSRLTAAGVQLEKARKALKDPYLEAGRAIDRAAEGPAARVEAAKRILKDGLVAFDIAEKKRIADAEAKRQAELARLQALKDEEDRKAAAQAARLAEIARKAQEAKAAEEKRLADETAAAIAAGAPAGLGIMDEEPEAEEPLDLPPPAPVKTQTEIALEQLQHAPAVVAAKPQGVTMRVTLEIESTDLAVLPEPFVIRTANLQAIRAAYCVKWKEDQSMPACPGVKFVVKREPVSTRSRI